VFQQTNSRRTPHLHGRRSRRPPLGRRRRPLVPPDRTGGPSLHFTQGLSEPPPAFHQQPPVSTTFPSLFNHLSISWCSRAADLQLPRQTETVPVSNTSVDGSALTGKCGASTCHGPAGTRLGWCVSACGWAPVQQLAVTSPSGQHAQAGAPRLPVRASVGGDHPCGDPAWWEGRPGWIQTACRTAST
jgi:hypothetical protein